MSPEEAIRRIKNHNEVHSRKEKHFAVHITEALNMAVEALEKQIPEKPILKETKCFDGSTADFVFVCPVCNRTLFSDPLTRLQGKTKRQVRNNGDINTEP